MLRAWYLNALLTVSASGIDEVFAGENTGADDRLGRGSLAAHLIERLHQLTGTGTERSPSAAAGDVTGSGIVHVDGRWGAGKTTFIELMLRSWTPTEDQPLVVRYDAWRQSAIAPEWWSLASETRRAIHRSRAQPTRWVMTVGGFLRRLVRSTSTWVALLAVFALALLGRWLVGGQVNLPQQLDAVAKLLTTITGVLAVAFVITRNLFWSAPVLGRLHVRTDDNPLGEISGIVGQLRRWAPRPGVPQRFVDWSITVWLAITLVMTIWWQPLWTAWQDVPATTRLLGLRIVTVVVLLVLGFRLRVQVAGLLRRLVDWVARWPSVRPWTALGRRLRSRRIASVSDGLWMELRLRLR